MLLAPVLLLLLPSIGEGEHFDLRSNGLLYGKYFKDFNRSADIPPSLRSSASVGVALKVVAEGIGEQENKNPSVRSQAKRVLCFRSEALVCCCCWTYLSLRPMQEPRSDCGGDACGCNGAGCDDVDCFVLERWPHCYYCCRLLLRQPFYRLFQPSTTRPFRFRLRPVLLYHCSVQSQ